MLLSRLPIPSIIAHRGSSAHAPENTIAAFELALEQGADAIELDAKLTADGEVVVIHDQTVNRTTGGVGKVREMRLDQLRTLDAGEYYDSTFIGEKIPTLGEVFEAVGHSLYINVELTNYATLTDSLPEKVAELVKQHGMSEQVLFSSFNPLALSKIRSLVPEAPLGLLAMPGIAGAWAFSPLSNLIHHHALHPEKSSVTPSRVASLHNKGKKIFVYTVNDSQTMRDLYSWKVDGIITDDPVLARDVLTGAPH
jgi:glycerophosphoryl diester phosphodiesterase